MRVTKKQIAEIAASISCGYAQFMAFIAVESNGNGFSDQTGRLIIQFEPSYFKKTYAEWQKSSKARVWLNNKVENQAKEWLAFNDAFSLNPVAAMQSCSIGLGQVMGYHYARLGFKTVNAMWDFAKGWDGTSYDKTRGEYNQVVLIALFIKTDSRLLAILQKKILTIEDFDMIAKYYNGWYYKELAVKIGREPYDKTMFREYNKYIAN